MQGGESSGGYPDVEADVEAAALSSVEDLSGDDVIGFAQAQPERCGGAAGRKPSWPSAGPS
jgi:hypothetical protein